MRIVGVVIANGFSPEAKVMASLLAERAGRYEPLVLHHDPPHPHFKDEGAPGDFERASGAPIFRFDAGWRRNDEGRRSKLAKIRGWATLHWQMPRLIKIARAHRPDAVYSSQQVWDCHVASLLARALRIPQVIHLHYLVGPWLGRGPLARLSQVSGVVCISDFIRGQAQQHGVAHERICVIPNTLRPFAPPSPGTRDSVRAGLGIEARAPLFAFVARLADGKGHADTLRAFAAVHDQAPEARLIIVGDGPLRGSLEALASSLGASQAVQFLGFRRDVPALLAASDIFVHPSRNEPFGLSILEAAAAGLPTIAYRDAGPAEVIRHGETGLLVSTGDVIGLGHAMLRLVREPEKTAQLGRQALADLSARFNPTVEGARFADFLSTTVRKKSRWM